MKIRIRQRQWDGSPPADPSPEPGEVVAWLATLPLDAPSRARITPALSDEERGRMARFLRAADQERFLAGRGLLRALLGSCLGMPPKVIHFATGPRGKPLLATGQGRPLHFNVSHSGDLVAIALSTTFEVGVDVEEEGRLSDWQPVADRILSPREKAEMDTVPDRDRPRAFLNAWTRKEAILKATGEGLVDDLTRVEVSLAPGRPARILALGGIASRAENCSLHELPVPRGYVAALAASQTLQGPTD